MIIQKNTFKEKANEFKQALQTNQLLEGFDRTIFESTIERVIIGSYDDNNAITFVFKMDYSSGERMFDNPDNRYSARYNHVTPFIVDSDEDRERTLKYIFENTSELFNFNMEYPHYIFLPDGNGAMNKILKKSVTVKVMIINK